MPITPTYPGVYVEEVPSGVRTITGVSTSVAAFIGYVKKGPMNKAVQLFNMGGFEREFGGLDSQSEISYAVQQFFLNGGKEAWVVRTASDPLAKASVQISDTIDGSAVLTVEAISDGEWGNNIQVTIDYDTTDPDNLFNMTVSEYVESGDQMLLNSSEVFRNLSMDSSHSSYVKTVVNDETTGSKLVNVGADTNMPLQNGTVSDDLSTFPTLTATSPEVDVTIGSEGPYTASFNDEVPTTINEARSILESAIRSAKPDNSAFASASVEIIQDRLRILAGPTDASNTVIFQASAADATTVTELMLDTANNATSNVQAYTLGTTLAISGTAQAGGTEGQNGSLPDYMALIGSMSNKTGLYALEDVDLFNILCIPRTAIVTGDDAMSSEAEAQSVITTAINYCAERRAFFIVDTPTGIDKVQEVKDWLNSVNFRDKNAAFYFPRIRIPDPLNEYRLRSVGASGTVAGLYARIDSARGVWKAPAGTEASLVNVQDLDYTLTDPENGTLNPLGINCLRNFPVYGNICWGARTLYGADQYASEWKYIPVRRMALFLEESLYRGLKWVVFEPNDEPLWSQIRLNVGAFMHRLFRQGAFQGASPKEAYLVKCDSETTTQADIDLGIVNIVVGFAPLKPAEFVIIKIKQLAGQVQA